MKRHLFIYGNQQLEIKKAVEKHIQRLKKTHPDFEINVLDIGNITTKYSDVQAFDNELAYDSLFDSHKIIHLKNFQDISVAKSPQTINYIIETIKTTTLAENITLVVSARIRKITDTPKAFQNVLTEFATVKTMVTYDNFDPSRKIIEYAREYSIKLHPDAVSMLGAACGTDLEQIDAELSKLSLIFSEGKEIMPQDIFQSVSNHREYTLFNLTDSIIDKNLKLFFRNSDNYFEDKGNAPNKLLSSIAQSYQNLNLIATMRIRKVPDNQIISSLKTHPMVANKLIGQYQNYTNTELENILITFSRLDLRIKYASTKDGFQILRNVFINIIQNRYVKSHGCSADFCRQLIY